MPWDAHGKRAKSGQVIRRSQPLDWEAALAESRNHPRPDLRAPSLVSGEAGDEPHETSSSAVPDRWHRRGIWPHRRQRDGADAGGLRLAGATRGCRLRPGGGRRHAERVRLRTAGGGTGNGLRRVGASASRSHQARHRRLPGRRQRPPAGLDHGLRLDDGGLGPAADSRPGPAQPGGDVRQLRSWPYPAHARRTDRDTHRRRHGRPDQCAHRHPRPRQAGRTGLVDGRHGRPGPGGPAPRAGAPPGAVRHLPRDGSDRAALAGGAPDGQRLSC